MGKTKKMKLAKSSRSKPLPVQIDDDKFAKPKERVKFRERTDADDEYVDDRLSRRILEQARLQQQDLEEEYGASGAKPTEKHGRSAAAPKLSQDSDDSSEESEEEMPSADYDCGEVKVDAKDEKTFKIFMNPNPAPRRTLGDIIMKKIKEKNTELQTQFSDAGSVQMQDLDPSVKQLYKGVREVLSKYRSGKIPKAFKIVPHLSNWEQILYLTDPPSWTAAALLQATRIFTANLKEKRAQRFFNLVLLPRVQDDIAEYKRLNFHLYQALRKSLFKPGAFMKGILLPLCESGTCTLREAIVIGSIVARNSIPVLHSAAAILKIAEMEYSGANSIFLRILFDKKYALPYRVVDAIVNHFVKFRYDRRQLPVLWHQALLTFVQRYKGDIASEQKEALLDLLKAHFHPTITQEIRRELQNFQCRDEVAQEQPMDQQLQESTSQ